MRFHFDGISSQLLALRIAHELKPLFAADFACSWNQIVHGLQPASLPALS